MPRNRNKTHCHMPGCHAWAMLGHRLCRTHRDDELGPRGGGAPQHNLDALKTSAHAHPLASLSLAQLARNLVHDPDHLPDHLAAAIGSIHARTGDPHKTIVAFQKALSRLLPLLAARLFAAQVEALLRDLPPSERAPFLTALQARATGPSPKNDLASLRRWLVESRKDAKTSTGTDSSPATEGRACSATRAPRSSMASRLHIPSASDTERERADTAHPGP